MKSESNTVQVWAVLEEGGKWLGVTRDVLLWHAHNSDTLVWGSSDQVKGLTVRDIERMVAAAVAADRNERSGNV